jgi:hypothetical protein
MDLLQMKHQTGALCWNDAKSCYNQHIVHWVVALCMRRLELQKEPTFKMFKTIQQAWDCIATAYEESVKHYRRDCRMPLQGFAFVNDTDVVHGGRDTKTKGEQVLHEMQAIAD